MKRVKITVADPDILVWIRIRGSVPLTTDQAPTQEPDPGGPKSQNIRILRIRNIGADTVTNSKNAYTGSAKKSMNYRFT
jgi:hypothetical protein